ncbi:MAG: sigma-54 dependent transcriptional regulator [candidate division KSB1 bacterium]|nr:sigma-54 dependent transcriptional regulator [candidate division KSB1 bacterium]MDZ7303727.1 sigma-54 dependent transcriptional regulator [candidate division KSB1 bacterium]MDZ7313136.1 sigma-54 dependent transcriptional regulator [candidate division KSB1 bacterium]
MIEPKLILVVDDEAPMRKNLSELLSEEGYAIDEATDGLEAIAKTNLQQPQLILLDIKLPKMDGLTALAEIKKIAPDVPVIVFTAHGTSERAIEAMKLGAYDYLEKPFDLDEFLLIVQRALKYGDLLSEVKHLRSQVVEETAEIAPEQLIGASGKMQEVFKLIGRAAPSEATVLIQGESGTGKELIANAIQRHSRRSDKPFIKVNCAALPETLLESELFGHEKGAFTDAIALHKGRFELADGGTIFLDEISDTSPALQTKLLRVLQQKTFERVGGKETITVDVRVIAATNKDLEREMKAGRFRDDLFYRLNVIHIKVAPLREHPEDVPLLVEHFLKKYGGSAVPIAAEALQKLRYYSWPGNVRELENVIQRALVMSQGHAITLEHLPLSLRAEGDLIPREVLWREGIPLKQIIADVEKQLILKALRESNGNRTRAAQLLGINRRLLFSKMKEHQISGEKNENA